MFIGLISCYYRKIFIVPNCFFFLRKMAFVRIKKVKGKDYAYLVECKYFKKGPKQKVKAYLGKVVKVDCINDISFNEFCNVKDIDEYAKENNHRKIMKDLVRWELHKHAFEGELPDNVVLKINEGYLCNYNVRKLLRFDIGGDENLVGYTMAKMFVDSGIKVPQDIFVEYYKKVIR